MLDPYAALRRALAAAALAPLVACSSSNPEAPPSFEAPDTAVDYDVAVQGAPEDLEGTLESALALYRFQEDGAQSPAFLRARARGDIDVARRVLRSAGYFQPEISVNVGDPPVEPAEAEAETTPAVIEDEGDEPAAEPDHPRLLATMTIDPGPLFTLESHDFALQNAGEGPLPALDPLALGSPVGEGAAAAPILSAEDDAIRLLRRNGRPYAERLGRDAVADLEADTIAVSTIIDVGPYYVLGSPSFEGLEDVDADYVATYQTWEEGQPYDEEALNEFADDVIGTGLFDVVSALPPEEPPEGDATPVVVRVEEGLFQTVSAGVRYDTDAGPAVRGRYEHRNLFGANETFSADAIVGLEEQTADFRYIEPQFLRPGQDFIAGLALSHIDDDAFEEYSATVTAGFERALSDELTVGAGGLLEYAHTIDNDDERDFLLAGLPLFADYDSTDDSLDPSQGWRARADLIPFTGYATDGGDPLFTRFDATASTYYAIDAERLYVLAGRGRFGSIVSEDRKNVPAGRRLYSGGEGSVRAFERRAIGPRESDGDPAGGFSVVELGAEIRAQVADPFGVVGFVEAGSVGQDPFPDFEQEPRVGGGVGVRYRSPVGPIRADIAVPFNPREGDDDFLVYVSIGQAF
jgi:translocation and assembly module TamA